MSARVRHITSLLAVLGILLGAQGGLVAHVLFKIRQDYIVEHLCENRANVEAKCHGKCFLKKRLAEAEHAQHEHAFTPVISPVSFFLPYTVEPELPRPESRYTYLLRQERLEFDGYLSLIDPPPRVG